MLISPQCNMSDPDQEEMRRKRLARLSAMSGGGGREGGEAGGGVPTVPSPAPVVGDKSLKTQSQVSFVPVEAMEVDPAPASVTSPVKRNHELRQL